MCDTKVPCSIPNLPYMVGGSSVSRKASDEVFLNCHIWSLDCLCHDKRMTKKTNFLPYKFLCNTKIPCSTPNLPYMVVGSSVSQKASDKVFLNCHIWSLDCQCCGKHVMKFSCIAIYGRRTVSVTEIVQRRFPDFCQVA